MATLTMTKWSPFWFFRGEEKIGTPYFAQEVQKVEREST